MREDLEKQVEDFSARLRMLELDLRTARDEMRVLKEETESAQKKVGALEMAKVSDEHFLQRIALHSIPVLLNCIALDGTRFCILIA